MSITAVMGKGDLDMENLQQAALPRQGNVDGYAQGHNPEAPSTRNIHLCLVCSINEIDWFLPMRPFILHPVYTAVGLMQNINTPEPSLRLGCRAPFREATRIFCKFFI